MARSQPLHRAPAPGADRGPPPPPARPARSGLARAAHRRERGRVVAGPAGSVAPPRRQPLGRSAQEVLVAGSVPRVRAGGGTPRDASAARGTCRRLPLDRVLPVLLPVS